MNWYTFMRHLKESVKSNRNQIFILDNKDYTLTVSNYMTDEWIRLTSKRFNSVYWYRPFTGQDEEELKERMTKAGFRRLIIE